MLHRQDVMEQWCKALEKAQAHATELFGLRMQALPDDQHLFSLPLEERLQTSTPQLKASCRIVTKLSKQWGVTALARAAQGSFPLTHFFDAVVLTVPEPISEEEDEDNVLCPGIVTSDEDTTLSDSTPEHKWVWEDDDNVASGYCSSDATPEREWGGAL